MRLLSIDPGFAQTGGTAFAEWWDGKLIQARLVRSADSSGRTGLPLWLWLAREVEQRTRRRERVVIEMPRTYGGRAKVGDANTMIQLGTLVGVLAATLSESGSTIELISVPEVPKGVTENRIHAKLSPTELKLIEAAAPRSLRHNVYDAVGIGLRVLKGR